MSIFSKYLKSDFTLSYVFALLLVASISKAQAAPPSHDVAATKIALSQFALLEYVDLTGNLTAADIKQHIDQAKPTISRFSYSSEQPGHWFVFTLHNSSKQAVERLIRLDEAYPEVANLH